MYYQHFQHHIYFRVFHNSFWNLFHILFHITISPKAFFSNWPKFLARFLTKLSPYSSPSSFFILICFMRCRQSTTTNLRQGIRISNLLFSSWCAPEEIFFFSQKGDIRQISSSYFCQVFKQVSGKVNFHAIFNLQAS